MTEAVYTVRNFLPAEDAYKTTSERAIQKKQKQMVTWLGTKLLIKLQKSQELHYIIVQRQLQMKQKILDLTVKYLKKDSKLFMI